MTEYLVTIRVDGKRCAPECYHLKQGGVRCFLFNTALWEQGVALEMDDKGRALRCPRCMDMQRAISPEEHA